LGKRKVGFLYSLTILAWEAKKKTLQNKDTLVSTSVPHQPLLRSQLSEWLYS
jgi:hypothetical protein